MKRLALAILLVAAPVRAADGLLDGRTETLLITPGKPGDLGLLRVTDAAHNVVTFDLTQR